VNDWLKELTEREVKEIAFACAYAESFNHGTDGHSRLILISKLVALLDKGYGKPVAVVPDLKNPSDRDRFKPIPKPAAIRD
jgi:hypothetical protein